MKDTTYSQYKYYRGQEVNPYANPFDLDQPLEGLFDEFWKWEQEKQLASGTLTEQEKNILLGKDKDFNAKMNDKIG